MRQFKRQLRNVVAISTILSTTGLVGILQDAGAQPGPPTPTPPPPPPPPIIILPPPPPPPMQVPPPPMQPPPPPPFIPPRVVPTFTNPLLVPTDVTKVDPNINQVLPLVAPGGPDPVAGITELKSFPSRADLKGPTDFIRVQGDPNCYKRETQYLVNLLSGTVLVSVKRPSMMGMLLTPLAEIAFSANSDAFVSFENGVVRIRNVDGLGSNIKVLVTKGPHAGTSYAISPGYELVIGEQKLTRNELRPKDGLLRRRPQLLADGFVGISQFQVESALQQSAIVAQMQQQESDAKTKRVLADMSRMAAVLNHVNGYDGYAP